MSDDGDKANIGSKREKSEKNKKQKKCKCMLINNCSLKGQKQKATKTPKNIENVSGM